MRWRKAPSERAGRSAPGRRRAEIRAMITFEHVSKSFDSLKVLNDRLVPYLLRRDHGGGGTVRGGEDHHPQAHHRHPRPGRGIGAGGGGRAWDTCSRSRGCCPGAPLSTTWPLALRAQGMDKAEAREKAAGLAAPGRPGRLRALPSGRAERRHGPAGVGGAGAGGGAGRPAHGRALRQHGCRPSSRP